MYWYSHMTDLSPSWVLGMGLDSYSLQHWNPYGVLGVYFLTQSAL